MVGMYHRHRRRRRRLNLANNRPYRTATYQMAITDTAVAGTVVTRVQTSSARRLVTISLLSLLASMCVSRNWGN